MKSKDKRTFLDSVKNCLDGICYVFEHERNFRIEIFLAIIVLIFSFILKISTIEFIIVLLLINFILLLEMLNTALERVVDLYTTKYNELAKAVKDIASASVLLVSFFAGVIGIIIFLPKIINLLK